MTSRFPRLDILPMPQRALWPELAHIPDRFTLYGGTAIALQLGHRQSVDFDFFCAETLDPRELATSLPFLMGAELVQVEPNTLGVIVERDGPVSLSFFGLPGSSGFARPLVAPDIGLSVASLVDLAGSKAATVQSRAEAKDYVDIDAMITHGIDLSTALSAAHAIFGESFSPMATLKALTFFDDGNLASLDEATRRRLVEAVRAVDPEQPFELRQ